MIFAADIESGVTQAECEKLAELAQDKVVLEIGAQYGRSTIALASTARVVHTVDPFLWGNHGESTFDLCTALRANLKRYDVADKVVVHVGHSADVLPVFGAGFFDGVFIDGDHSKMAVIQDVLLSRRLVAIHAGGGLNVGKPAAGFWAFHDYCEDPFSEVPAALEGLPAYLGMQMGVVDTLAVLRP